MKIEEAVYYMVVRSVIKNAFDSIENDKDRAYFLGEMFDQLIQKLMPEEREPFTEIMIEVFEELRRVSDQAETVESIMDSLGWNEETTTKD